MSREVLLMLKKVALYSFIIGLVITVLVYVTFNDFALTLFVGLVVGIINFVISSVVTDLLFTKYEGRYLPLYLLSFLLRIAVISIIGFLLYVQNRYNIFAYVGGYMIHLIGVSIHSLNQKNVN